MFFETCLLGLHLLTYHFIPPQDGGTPYRTITPGVYAKCESGLTAGYFKNSFGHPSQYVGYSWDWGNFSLIGAAVHGYEASPVLPIVFPSYKFDHVRLSLLPDDHLRPLAVNLSVEF
jgi:hypothetical protein